MAEILSFCRRRSIPVAARGSAVGSLALHLLGGSLVDPLSEGLLFERFLNELRPDPPDVDLDIPHDRRDEVIRRVYARFGRDKVAMVSAHHRFGPRSALREDLQALGVPPARLRMVSRLLPPEEIDTGETALQALSRRLEARKAAPGGIQELLPLVGRLVGRPRHTAAHPGGILVGRSRLEDVLPLERASKGVVVTQFDMAATAALGFVKIDLLGNRCLSELVETQRLAGEPCGLASIPPEDPAAVALVDRADTIGCFQLESPAMRSLLSRLPVRGQRDIVSALALIRPGAAAGAAKEAFVARARGEAPVEDVDPAVAGRTKDTCGLLLYEEDIMVLLSRVGGLSLDEADRLRSDIVRSRGDPAVLARLEETFLSRAGRKGDPSPARARRAFAEAARFAAYAFNKAHAASYGRLSYFSAYMKARHPVAFTCALLDHHRGLYPLRTLAAEAFRTGPLPRWRPGPRAPPGG